MSEATERALRAAELLRAAGDLWNMTEMLSLDQIESIMASRLDGLAQLGEETETLNQRFGHMGLVAADLDQLEASCQRGVELCAGANSPWGYQFDV